MAEQVNKRGGAGRKYYRWMIRIVIFMYVDIKIRNHCIVNIREDREIGCLQALPESFLTFADWDKPVFKSRTSGRFATLAISCIVRSTNLLLLIYASASEPHFRLIKTKDSSQRFRATYAASTWTSMGRRNVLRSSALERNLPKEGSARTAMATRAENDDAPLKKMLNCLTISDQDDGEKVWWDIADEVFTIPTSRFERIRKAPTRRVLEESASPSPAL